MIIAANQPLQIQESAASFVKNFFEKTSLRVLPDQTLEDVQIPYDGFVSVIDAVIALFP